MWQEAVTCNHPFSSHGDCIETAWWDIITPFLVEVGHNHPAIFLQNGVPDGPCCKRGKLCQGDFLGSKYCVLPFNSYRILVQLVQMVYSLEISVGMKCRLIHLFLRRYCTRKHDFLQQLHNLITR